VIGENVGKKTNTERERTRQVIDDFDQQHKDHEWEPGEFPHWAEKAFEVAGALMSKTLVQVEEEADYRQAPSDVGVGGCRLHPWDQSQEIPEQDEQEKTAEKSNVGAEFVLAEQIPGESRHSLGDDLGARPHRDALVGNHWVNRARQRRARHQSEDQQDRHDEPCANQHGGNLPVKAHNFDEINRVQNFASFVSGADLSHFPSAR
jgi:hypothetical protein